MGLNQPIFAIRLFPGFQNQNTMVTYKWSRSYLTGVTAAELRRHLINMMWFNELIHTFAKSNSGVAVVS